MFNLQPDGTLAEIGREIAAIDQERSATISNKSISLVRLPGPKAHLRFLEGEDVHIVAMLPPSVDPRRIELFVFTQQGEMRVSYPRPAGSFSLPTWNTLSFHAQPLKTGGWLFEPILKLSRGEYCFSPKFNNDNFCFGIDSK